MFMEGFIAYKLLLGLTGPAAVPEWREQYVEVN